VKTRWRNQVSEAQVQLKHSIGVGSGRLDRAVLTAAGRERAELSALDWRLGVWAGLGDPRTVEPDVESALTAYFRRAEARGTRFGQVLGAAAGGALIVVAAVVGIVVQL
jgi:hypothetical protein